MTAAAVTGRCRHRPKRPAGRHCPDCRRDGVIDHVTAAGVRLSRRVVADAVDAVVADRPATLRSLAAALAGHPTALSIGAPPTIGRLVAELVARGGALGVPGCVVCGRTNQPLNVTDAGGMCRRCAHRRNAAPCTRCGATKPVAYYTGDGQPVCERCRRSTMTHLAAHLPAAVLADLLNLSPSTAVRWMHEGGADWTRYAAELVQDDHPQP